MGAVDVGACNTVVVRSLSERKYVRKTGGGSYAISETKVL